MGREKQRHDLKCPPTPYPNMTRVKISDHATECPKIYRKSVRHLLKYTANLYFKRCSTDLR